MRAIVYDLDTGEIIRGMNGNVPLDKQRLKNNEGLIADCPNDPPSGCPQPTYTDRDIPDNLDGKKVHTGNHTVIDDSSYEEPRTREDIKADLDAGEITHEEALEELLAL